MGIQILSVDRIEVVHVSPQVLGYRGRFRGSASSGAALIVPYSWREDALIDGARHPVETGQASVSQFEIVPPERAPCRREPSRSGDYAVVGTVEVVVGGQVIEIDVGELAFAVSLEESGGIVPRSGGRV